MSVNLSPVGGAAQQFFTNTGSPLSGGKIYTYTAGTTTPQTTYTTSSGSVAHTNPIILDSAGRLPGGEMWITNTVIYKFVLKDSADVLIGTYDNISGINATVNFNNASQVVYDPAGTGAVATTVQAKLRQTRSVMDFGAVGDGSTDNTTAIQAAMTAAGSGTLLFPDGVFNVSGTLTVPIGLKIQGTYRLGQNGNASGNNGGTKIVQTATGTGVASTTGTTSGDATGNYLLTVANTTGMAANKVITIAGAGVAGNTLYSKIVSVVGSVVTLESQWSTPVTSAVVTIQKGVNIFELHNTGYDNLSNNLDILGNSFEGLWLVGGYDQISAKNGGVWVTLNNMTFSSPTRSAVYFAGFVQQWFVQNIEMSAGPYGFFYGGAGISLVNNLFDKNRFYNIYFNGQSINGLNIILQDTTAIGGNPGNGQASNWINVTANYCAQEGMVFGGGLSDCSIIAYNNEANGYSNSTPTAPTTGSITSGTKSLVVASATGLAVGQTLTVQGAGLYGNDLISAIDVIAGTTITLRNNASNTVVSKEVVNYAFDDVALKPNIAGRAPSQFGFYGCTLGLASSVGANRYGLGATSQLHTISSSVGTRPAALSGTIIGNSQISIRQPLNAYNNFNFNNAATNEAAQSQFVSPPGTNIVLGLQAANAGTATGFGQWQGIVANSNRAIAWYIDGTTGVPSFSAVAPGNGYGLGAFASQRIFYASGTPASTAPWNASAWIVGDRAFNSAPVVGQPKGWLCTVAGSVISPLSTVVITGTAGQFSCAATSLAVGQAVVISGTLGGTGTITGYTNPTTYYIITTNGTTTFTLSTSLGGAAVVTTAGTPTGLTYTPSGSTWVSEGNL